MVNRLWVFDLEGNFKREKGYDHTYNFSSFVAISPTHLMGFSENAKAYTPDFITQGDPNANKITDFGRSLHFFNRNDLAYNQDIPKRKLRQTPQTGATAHR